MVFFFSVNFVPGSGKGRLKLSWQDLPPVPPSEGSDRQPGLAGPVTGSHGNYLLVAGGANFENAMPWQGGTKKYHDEAFLLHKEENQYSWQQSDFRLPFRLAYPSCVSTVQGVVVIGGENESGPVALVNRFTFSDGIINVTKLPDLPLALTAAGAAPIGDDIYLAGGISPAGVSRGFYRLNPELAGKGWEKLPDLPVPLSHVVVASQSDGRENCIYVFGGRNKTSLVSTFFASVWKFSPSKNSWSLDSKIKSMNHIMPLSAGTGISAGNDHILLFGGDTNTWFNATERLNNAIEKAADMNEKTRLIKERDSVLTFHPGFSHSVLAFQTKTKKWQNLPDFGGKLPVTTTAFYWDDFVVIPSGEIRPGVRTAEVHLVRINKD